MDRVEKGETIGVENDNGDKAVMTPADDEIIRIYRDLQMHLEIDARMYKEMHVHLYIDARLYK